MDLIEDNKFQNAFLIYVSIDLFYEKNELENDYDEFKSLVISSGLEIKDCRNFNQKIPSINTFITKGNLENLKLQISDKDIDILLAPASIEFSINSFNAELGLSITSPAAI